MPPENYPIPPVSLNTHIQDLEHALHRLKTDLLPWYKTTYQCPVCDMPFNSRSTDTEAPILELHCTHCGWNLDLEALRLSSKAIILPIVSETEDLTDDD